MGYSSAQAKEFIAKIAPLIQAEAKKRGYAVASPVIAQAILESAAGTSSLGYKYHNYFGMKCGTAWKGKSVNLGTKEEYTVGTLTSIKANFRVYDTMEEGVKGYFDFISSARYATLKSATTPKIYLERIKAAGYATSSSYVQNNLNVVKKYDLEKWDDFSVQPVTKPAEDDPIAKPTLRNGSKGDEVKKLQTCLNALNGNLVIDGKFGPKTETSLKKFQEEHGLVVDGIYGPKSEAELRKSIKR